MPEFLSKLQHNTYEKGEFSDERVRSLDDTIELIRNFPWDAERTFTDIQLTGPSITIRDEDLNYLKIGIYFTGFCLYYLDYDNHLYEYHTYDNEELIEQVTLFFNRQLNLQHFEKHLISTGNRSHFENGTFDYTSNINGLIGRLLVLIIIIPIFVGCCLSFFILDSPIAVKLIAPPICILFIIFCVWSFYLQVKYYIKSKDMLLTLSAGKPLFQYGNHFAPVQYNKADISYISIYGSTASRGSKILDIIEITFVNDTKIDIPCFLIDPNLFKSKMHDVKLNIIEKTSIIMKKWWQFANS